MKIVRTLSICSFLLSLAAAAFATKYDRTIAQYAHTTWGEKEGAPSVIWAMAQTPDGYLWLAAHEGLYRFDGVLFENYQPQSGGRLPTGGVDALLALPNGDLWIGFTSGMISLLRNGNITVYDGALIGDVRSFAQDREGTIWAATPEGLERLEGQRWKAVGRDWNFPKEPSDSAFVDRQGTLWVATEDTLYFLPAGARKFQPIGFPAPSVTRISQAANGKLWMSEYGSSSVRPIPLSDTRLPSDKTGVTVQSEAILFDRDGGLWIASFGSGLHHVSAPDLLKGKPGASSTEVESFTARDGLSDDRVRSILQDRQGNIWAGTNGGLDRFRKTNLVPVVLSSELNHTLSVLGSGKDGDAWLGNDRSIVRIDQGRDADQHLLPGRIISAFRDSAGATGWVCSNGIYSYDAGSYTRIPLPPSFLNDFRELLAVAVTSNSSDTLWLAARREGLFYRKQGKWQQIDIPQNLLLSSPDAAYTDWMGRAWFGYEQGKIIVIDQAKVWKIFPLDDSLVSGVLAINGRGRHVWIGGTAGAAFFDGNRILRIIPEDAERFESVVGVEETGDGSLWLAEDRGVIQIPASEARHFLDDPSYRVKYRLFDSSDGLTSKFAGVLTNPREIQGTDGKLWFAASRGVMGIDPAHLTTDTLPPPVFIRSASVSGVPVGSLEDLTLAARTTNLQISYRALSLSGSDKVRFRYMLEGVDKGWQEAGTRREAFYTGLGPGKHNFRVIACNNDGVWNEVGARLDFRIEPAWFQTLWFHALCLVLFLLLLWALYRLRLKQLERQFNATLQTRVDERTRIARELHDTLLQSFQGAAFQFQAARKLLLRNADNAMGVVDDAIHAAEEGITEGRAAIHDLRPEPAAQRNLPEALNAACSELATAQKLDGHAPTSQVVVEGKQRDLLPMSQDEIYRISREGIRNAFAHAAASHIEVEIRYDRDQFRVRIRDDGKGIDAKILEDGGRPGHWGISGMRERAQRIGARLDFWSEAGAGTEVQLTVPAAMAYEKRRHRRRFRLFQRASSDE